MEIKEPPFYRGRLGPTPIQKFGSVLGFIIASLLTIFEGAEALSVGLKLRYDCASRLALKAETALLINLVRSGAYSSVGRATDF